jgi:hypothetical protein
MFLISSLLIFLVGHSLAADNNASSIAIGEKIDVSKFNTAGSQSDLDPLYPKAGLLIAFAAFAFLVSSFVTPLVCGTKANAAVAFNDYNMRKSSLIGAITPAGVIFVVVFVLLIVVALWNHWLT